MSEPVYTYVRGSGWVPGPAIPSREVVMGCGTRVRIELRKPNPGELWDCGSPSTLDAWERVFKRSVHFAHLSEGEITSYSDTDTNWCTIIPLENV